jgi:hypothetical protein
MLHALRAELAYLRPWLFGGLGLALGVATLVTVIFAATEGPPAFAASAIRAMFPMMAPLIVGFIVQAFRNEERRARLLFAGPVTPRQLAIVSVLIPLALGVCGAVVAAGVVAIESAIRGEFVFETLHIVAYVGGMLLLCTEMGLLIQEAVVTSSQRRRGAAVAGWGTLAVGALLLTALSIAAFAAQGPWTWPLLHAGNVVAALAAAAVTIVLYTGRTDFTR